MWSRRRWSSSSFSRDGTRWAPHPFASMPSFAAGGLASLGLGATFALAGAASADASDPSAPQTAFGADVRVSSAALRDVSRDVADGPLARDAARFVSSRKSPCTSTTTTPSSPSPRSDPRSSRRSDWATPSTTSPARSSSGASPTSRSTRKIAPATILGKRDATALADAATPRRWRSSPPILARRAVSDAMRLIAELAADDATHETLVASGVVDALAQAAGISRWFPAWATMSPVAKRVVAHRQLVRVEDDEDVENDESDAWNVDGASVVSANGKKVTWRGDSGASTSPYATLRARSRRRETRVRGVVRTRRVERGPRRHRRVRGDANGGVARAFARARVAGRYAAGARRDSAGGGKRGSTTGSTTATLRTATLRAATRGLVSGDGQAACYATGAMRAACEDSNLRAKMARWAPSETSFGFWRTPERDGPPTPRRARRWGGRASRGRTKKPPRRRREG